MLQKKGTTALTESYLLLLKHFSVVQFDDGIQEIIHPLEVHDDELETIAEQKNLFEQTDGTALERSHAAACPRWYRIHAYLQRCMYRRRRLLNPGHPSTARPGRGFLGEEARTLPVVGCDLLTDGCACRMRSYGSSGQSI